jgi:hypothetical protein
LHCRHKTTAPFAAKPLAINTKASFAPVRRVTPPEVPVSASGTSSCTWIFRDNAGGTGFASGPESWISFNGDVPIHKQPGIQAAEVTGDGWLQTPSTGKTFTKPEALPSV